MSSNPDSISAWRVFQVNGSKFNLRSGIASTMQVTNGCSPSWFTGPTTVILGSGEVKGNTIKSRTCASWKVPVEPYWLQHFRAGYLAIGCLRYFGGLHSKHYGSKVEILLNDKHIDGFSLMIIPPDHTDYFHRIPLPPLPALPDIWSLTACQTTYVWPIQKAGLIPTGEQIVTVKLDKQVSWDIDYVCIICRAEKLPQKVFISHNWRDKEIARNLAKDLEDRDIGVWLDEAEIRLGDSLLEKISDGIDTVEYLLVLLSCASVESQWLKKEVEIAMTQEIEGKRIKVVPILLEDCKLPSFLKGKFWADLRSMSNYDKVIRQIEERLLP